jgi:hypothetical protein
MASSVQSRKSKTAAVSARAGAARTVERFTRAAQAPWIIPLDGGRHAWVLCHDAPTLQHLAVGSESFVAALVVLVPAGYEAQILEELRVLGWRDVEERLLAAVHSDQQPALDRPGTQHAA